MGTRYVWERYDRKTNYEEKESTTSANPLGLTHTATNFEGIRIAEFDSYSINADGTFNIGTSSSFYERPSTFGVEIERNFTKKYYVAELVKSSSDVRYTSIYKPQADSKVDIRYFKQNDTQWTRYLYYLDKIITINSVYTKGDKKYGNISNSARSRYPDNSYSGNYWYVYQGYDSIDPDAITYSAILLTNTPISITVTPSANTYGGTISYQYQVKLDEGTWINVKKAIETSISYTIPVGTKSFQARVLASDDMGFTSTDYVTGNVSTVTDNNAPEIISDQPADLGEKNETFSFTYTVNDVDADTVTVKELLDGVQKRSYTATLGQENTFDVTEYYQQILNGSHTLKVTANDGKATSEKSWTFIKQVTACSVTLETPLDADAAITVARLAVSGNIPPDANFMVQVTNNGKDDEPVWEDATAAVKNGTNIVFANQTAQNGFAFNFKLDVSRGESDTGGYITSVQGAFQ